MVRGLVQALGRVHVAGGPAVVIAERHRAVGVAERLRAHGFTDVRVVPLLLGLMSLHIARR